MMILERYKDTKGYILGIYCDKCKERMPIEELPLQGYTDDEIFCLKCKSKNKEEI